MSAGNGAIYKVIVVGDLAVGASSLLTKFSTNQLKETVGVSILIESIEIDDMNATVNLIFWRIVGLPQFYMLHRPYFNGADGIVMVFDITRSSTFSNINYWYNNAVRYGLSGIPRILIGNKIDLKDERRIILPMAEHLSQKLNAPYFETSALTGENVKNALHKIAELVYRAKELGDFRDEEPLIVRNHEETSNDDDGLEKTLDWKSKLVLLKVIQPSSSVSDSTEIENDTTHDGPSLKRKPLSPPIEMDKREKRALETTFRYFNGSKLEKSQTELLSAIETRDLVVLTSKYKFQTVLAFFFGFFFIYIIWGVGFFLLPMVDDAIVYRLLVFEIPGSGARLIVITMIIILIGVSGRLIAFAIYLRYYFIVLDSQGIYYKKIGKPRFISWADIAWIKGYMRYVRGNPTERAIRLHLKSKKKIRFNSSNYLFKRKFFDFNDVFKSFKFRRCPFFSIGNNAFGADPLRFSNI